MFRKHAWTATSASRFAPYMLLSYLSLWHKEWLPEAMGKTCPLLAEGSSFEGWALSSMMSQLSG